ncbi:hypothetical protein DL762_007535 [Monosporascus cannonballus]|uniref:B box-type domain-containing protein n=1 Tax=Monosporascus cannonballus TaxID=155416 RepID=A0ABY0GZD2_9PEZI|nr:hypothetical protein DL762_007535 [Monosporascus cannonballus]
MSAEGPTSPDRASSGHTVSGSSSGMGASPEERSTYPDGSSLGAKDGGSPDPHARPVGDNRAPGQGNAIPRGDDEAEPMDVDTLTAANKPAPVSKRVSTLLASQHRYFGKTWEKNETCDICNRKSAFVKQICLECDLIICKSCHDRGRYDKRHNLSGLILDWEDPPPSEVRRGRKSYRCIRNRRRERRNLGLVRHLAPHHFDDLLAAAEAVAVDGSSAGNISHDQSVIGDSGQARAVRQGRTALPSARPRPTTSSSGGAVLPVPPRPVRGGKGRLSDALEMLQGAAILESLCQGDSARERSIAGLMAQ